MIDLSTFELYVRPPSRFRARPGLWVTIYKHGGVLLSQEAFEVIGSPDRIVWMIDPKIGAIGIRAASEGEERISYRVRNRTALAAKALAAAGHADLAVIAGLHPAEMAGGDPPILGVMLGTSEVPEATDQGAP